MKLTLLIVLIGLSSPSQAEIISISIPAFNGRYEYVNDSRIVTFDMGVRFSSITSASIKVTAQGVDGFAQVCHSSVTGLFETVSYSCMDYRESPKATFYLFNFGHLTESGSLVVDSTDWNTTSAILSETDSLLDGKLTLGFDVEVMDFHGYITVPPFLFVSELSIIIDGVVAPSADVITTDKCQELLGAGTVSTHLDIQSPLLNYKGESHWANFEYLGTNSQQEQVWGLKAFGVNQFNSCNEIVGTGRVASNLDIFFPSMVFDTPEGTQNIWAKLKYLENFIYKD